MSHHLVQKCAKCGDDHHEGACLRVGAALKPTADDNTPTLDYRAGYLAALTDVLGDCVLARGEIGVISAINKRIDAINKHNVAKKVVDTSLQH